MAVPSIDAETILLASGSQLSSRLGDETVILGLDDGLYYGLDGVGSRVWSLLAEPRSVAALRDAIVDEYDVDAATCEADLVTLLEDLLQRGLVSIHDGTAD
ncbi:MAG: hypothetical protein JWO05_1728 [Gemmatimonadetes bacterium]|nr:hypothetical protein [Gemmatimonadota bacterium]